MANDKIITIIGGGLAGVEAANQVSRFGLRARLYEMRPGKFTPAHKTESLGELVCSNSLKSDSLENASGVLKEEMRILGSVVMESADKVRVPAGKALAVDREKFAQYLTKKIEGNPLIEIVREEVKGISSSTNGPVIIATGPLTSQSLSEELARITGSKHLYFFDAISPIIEGESIDYSKVFRASRYGRGVEEGGDYINCPMNEEQYYAFVEGLLRAEKVETRDFEKALYFESCLPIEVMAERGKDTLRFGPMRPVGLTDPCTGETPFAVVQLRRENLEGTMYNMVGFQTKLKYPEQGRLFRTIPGFENAEFLRYGSVHRNTYIDSPRVLEPTLQLREHPLVFLAGQLTGVEGYVESAAMGIIAGINVSRIALREIPLVPPPETAIGALLRYITDKTIKEFQPMNINFGLFTPPEGKIPKSEKRSHIVKRALSLISSWNPWVLRRAIS